MAYFLMDGVDYSHCVNQLKVSKDANYNAQTNAAGNTVIDFINYKHTVEVGIIPLDQEAMAAIQNKIGDIEVAISYRDPHTNQLVNLNCMLPSHSVEYYTIQINKVMYKAFTLTFIEL